MQTRLCASCQEIVPGDVDYCPYCGNSTRQAIEHESDWDTLYPPDAVDEAADGRPKPKAKPHMCMMCMQKPPEVGDYCLDCEEKLNMRPEQWDMMRQDELRNTLIAAAVAAAAVIVLAIVIAVTARSEFRHARSTVTISTRRDADNNQPIAPAPAPPPIASTSGGQQATGGVQNVQQAPAPPAAGQPATAAPVANQSQAPSGGQVGSNAPPLQTAPAGSASGTSPPGSI